jgi:hypothetical protein
MKQPTASPLTVVMPSACSKCRNRIAVIGSDNSLNCVRCRQHRGRLERRQTDFIKQIISTFGGLTTPIVLRQSTGIRAVGCQRGHRSSS